jgi:hypothetical protein
MTEYLYNHSGRRFRIIKKTKKRIFYARDPLLLEGVVDEYPNIRDLTYCGVVGGIDRQEIELNGKVRAQKRLKTVSATAYVEDLVLYLKPDDEP